MRLTYYGSYNPLILRYSIFEILTQPVASSLTHVPTSCRQPNLHPSLSNHSIQNHIDFDTKCNDLDK